MSSRTGQIRLVATAVPAASERIYSALVGLCLSFGRSKCRQCLLQSFNEIFLSTADELFNGRCV